MRQQFELKRTAQLAALLCVMLLAAAVSGCATKNPAPDNTAAPDKTASSGTTDSANKQEPKTTKQWSEPPAMTIDPKKKYTATVKTNKGSFTIDLLANKAPKTVNNFVFLAKEGFFDGVPVHRIVKNYIIQTGDPTGTGKGGPGYRFEDELNTGEKYGTGVVAMANSGSNTNGSQFFICSGKDSEYLNKIPNYTIFGKIASGMDSVLAIDAVKTKVGPQGGEPSVPAEDVHIESVQIAVGSQ